MKISIQEKITNRTDAAKVFRAIAKRLDEKIKMNLSVIEKTKNYLLPALRQHRHNHGSEELIAAYDYDETNELISKLIEEMKPIEESKNEKLCYIEVNFAYFTTQDLKDQLGDDWNDAPYEHNAGAPYEWNPKRDKDKTAWTITKVAFDGYFNTPETGRINSQYSVQDINRRVVPWLFNNAVVIHAGVSIEEFKSLVLLGGGSVYEKTVGE